MSPLLIVLSFLLQDEEAAARKILEASALTLRKAAAVSFEAEITQNSERPGTPPAPRVSRFILQRPNLLRIETAGKYDTAELISDGRLLTSVRRDAPSKVEYTQHALADPRASPYLPRDPVLAIYFGPEFMGDFEGAADLRASREQIDGQDCDVVSGAFRIVDASDFKRTRSFRLWLGRDRLPRKFTQTTETEKAVSIHTTVYSKFDLEAKPDDGAFAFKPPEGAKHLNRKANQPEDLPKTPAAQKAQEILVAVHKSLRGFESVRYERAEDRVTLRRPLQLRIDGGESGSGYSYIVDGASRFHVEEFRKRIRAEESALDFLTDIDRSHDALIPLFFQEGTPLLLAGATEVSVDSALIGGETCDLIQWTSFASKGAFRLFIGPDRRIRRFARSAGVYNYNPTDGTQSYKITGWATSTYKSFDPAPKISDDFFAFKPPPEWRDTRREKRPASGSPAPDFDVADRDGKRARLADFRGKPLALIFIGDHDPQKFDSVQKAHAEFAPKGVAVVGVFIGREKPAYDPTKHDFRLLTPADDSLERAYAVLDDRADVLIDSKGRIFFAGTISNTDYLNAGLKRLR